MSPVKTGKECICMHMYVSHTCAQIHTDMFIHTQSHTTCNTFWNNKVWQIINDQVNHDHIPFPNKSHKGDKA